MKHLSLLASCAIVASVTPAIAELNLWQSDFKGCSNATSPFADQVLFKDASNIRPLMQIAGLSAWAVPAAGGGQQVALTTPDGLTIYARIVGPQGEDISAALLGTVPTNKGPDTPLPPQTLDEPKANSGPVKPNKTALSEPSQPLAVPITPQTPSPVPEAASPVAANPLIQTPAGAMTGIEDPRVPKATNLDELVQQADTFAMWIEGNKPKPGAPLIYMFIDPTCPYCAQSIESLLPKIKDGSIEIRFIPTPILSVKAFNIAASVMHQQYIAENLIQQMQSIMGTAQPAPVVEPATFDRKVVEALRTNVLWFRKNGIRSVPFYLFRTKDGGNIAFGNITDEQIASALPDPAKMPPPQAGTEAPK